MSFSYKVSFNLFYHAKSYKILMLMSEINCEMIHEYNYFYLRLESTVKTPK